MLTRSYKYRCYPTAEQERILTTWQVACHAIQRELILDRRGADALKGRGVEVAVPNGASQGRLASHYQRQYADLRAVPSDTMGAVVKRVDQAWQAMWKERKASKKRAKARWAVKPAHVGLLFRGDEKGTRLERQKGHFGYWQLAGTIKQGIFGTLKTRMHRPIPEGGVVKQAHITRAADGWYISFSCEIPDPLPLPPARNAIIGVDLNVKHNGDKQEVAAVDDGRKYTLSAKLKTNSARLATLQKLVSHKRTVKGTAKSADPDSKRTAKRRAKIARLHQRIARQRDHEQQFIARRLVDTADKIALEKLNLVGLRRKGKGRRKSGLNRAQSTAAPGKLIALIKEKAQAGGRVVEQVNPKNTTQQCSVCGHLPAETKGLGVRRWTCPECHTDHDRDINAARNIAKRAGKVYSPLFKRGVPGEGSGPEPTSVNLEAALPQGVSKAQADTPGIRSRIVRNSRRILDKKQLADQLSLFDPV